MTRTLAAWAVHAFTALGLIAAAGIAVLLVEGGELAFKRVFELMILATAIDALDDVVMMNVRLI